MNGVTLELVELKNLGVEVSQSAIEHSEDDDEVNEYLNSCMSEGDVADLLITLYS